MKDKRLQKIKYFEFFYDNSKTVFTDLGVSNKRVEFFQNEYMLCICPGSRAGGNEKRIVEIFWGARPYEFETKGKNWKSLTETGATLFFYRNDTGDVTVSLYPAKTDFRKPIEDYITLHEWLDPKRLNDKNFIQSLWNDFVAYMESTSLDGKPTFSQQFRVWYLRHFKHLVINQKWEPKTKFATFYQDTLKWIFTVVVSGILINVASTILTETTETEILLKDVNKNLKTISNQIGSSVAKDNKIKEIFRQAENVSTKNDSISKEIKPTSKETEKKQQG